MPRTRSSTANANSDAAAMPSPAAPPPAPKDNRVLIVQSLESDAVGVVNNLGGCFLQLCHPKSGISTTYVLINDSLQELHWFKQQYSSWFLGNDVCEDGSLYIATPVDPIFIILPLLDKGRMKKGDDPGKFRSLEDILFLEGYPEYRLLYPLMHDLLTAICEVKDVCSMNYYRLDEQKLIAWLCCKVNQLTETLPTLNRHYAGRNESDAVSDAIGFLGEYLKEDPWLLALCAHLGLNLETIKKPRMKEPTPMNLAFDSHLDSDLPGSHKSKGKTTQKNSASRGRPSQKKVDEKGLQKITSMFKKS